MRRANRGAGLILALPAILQTVVFFVLPLVILLPASLFKFDALMRPSWVGLDNLRAVVASGAVQRAAGVTAFLGIVTFCSCMGAALIGGWALSVAKSHRLGPVFQVCTMLATSSNSVFWVWLFAPMFGGWAQSSLPSIAWHADPWAARWAVAILLFAWNFPAQLYFVSVATHGVPREMLEAASLDGANAWQAFWSITIPTIRRPLTYLAVTFLAGVAQIYEAPLVLWQGGPLGATTTMMMRIADADGGYGMAAATAVLLAVFVSGLSYVAWKVGER